jgi:transposase
MKISEGGIHNLLQRFTRKANPVYQEIKSRIQNASSVGTDETGAKVNGKKNWYWVWQTQALTYIAHSMNRGIDTIKYEFVNGLPNAILTHDRWSSHFHCTVKGHQLCIPHLLKDLKYLEELYQSEWATDLKKLFLRTMEFKKMLISRDYLHPNNQRDIYELQLTTLLNYPIDNTHKKANTLQKSLVKNRNYIFTFLYYEDVSPDNNASERSIRNVKVKQKISGQFKSIEGAQIYAINRSIIDTMVKSNQNIMSGLNIIANFSAD